MAVGRPPLALQAEVVYPDNTTSRWDADTSVVGNEPLGITFKTQRYTGFADAQLTLSRRIDLDYPDLALLDGLNLIGYDGSVAYEGRIATLPRSLAERPSIGVQAQGWIAHAKDQPFVEAYIDRDLTKWVQASAAMNLARVTAGYSAISTSTSTDEAGNPAIVATATGPWEALGKPTVEAWWNSPGIVIGGVYTEWARGANTLNSDTNWEWLVELDETDTGTNPLNAGNLRAAGPGAGLLSGNETARTFARLLFAYNAAGGASGKQYNLYWRQLAVLGTHGLERHGEGPGGLYVSDMVKNIASRWAPKLDTSLVQQTTFPVPHASFTSDTYPYDACQSLNAYHRWELGVYEKRRLEYRPIDLSDWDWEIRTTDPGTTIQLQGDDASKLCNGVIVHYRDLASGYEKRITPATNSELADKTPDNPVNIAGLTIWPVLELSVPTTAEAAVQIGRVYLAEFNQAAAPGTITITGHVRDRAGHWQQGWKVRAGDRLTISDLPNETIRVVGETQWTHDSKQLTIAVDSSFKRLDAILARLGVAVESAGLKLP